MDIIIRSGRESMQLPRIKKLLEQTYWARERSEETIELSMAGSLCFGAFLPESGEQVGFARIITDYAATFYLCDVVIDEAYRGRGFGLALVEAALSDARIQGLRGILATGSAHGLYERFGFKLDTERFMERTAKNG